jgi:uncharacterized protein DUF6221
MDYVTGDAAARLSARLDEDEQVARAAGDGRWRAYHKMLLRHAEPDEDVTFRIDGSGAWNEAAEAASEPIANHAARHDPARVLNDVAVGRQIIELWRDARRRYEQLADARACSMAPTKPEPSELEKRAMDQADAYEKVVELLLTPQPVVSGGWRA